MTNLAEATEIIRQRDNELHPDTPLLVFDKLNQSGQRPANPQEQLILYAAVAASGIMEEALSQILGYYDSELFTSQKGQDYLLQRLPRTPSYTKEIELKAKWLTSGTKVTEDPYEISVGPALKEQAIALLGSIQSSSNT